MAGLGLTLLLSLITVLTATVLPSTSNSGNKVAQVRQPVFEYWITTTWDSRPTGHEVITLTLSQGEGHLKMKVDAPFFNDPQNPGGAPGEPFPGLWNYEVVEAFFLAKDGKYLEVEVCPHGQHLVLFLNATRSCIKQMVPMMFTSEISGATWSGEAEIPETYLPPGVFKFNAYAIHGSGEARQYEALYPAPEGKHEAPDFHRLEYFQPIDFKELMPNNECSELSDIWRSKAEGNQKC